MKNSLEKRIFQSSLKVGNTNNFLENISILKQIESRLDEELNFFLRLDKEKWVNEKEMKLTDSGKCFHIKISVAAFPKNMDIAIRVLENLFKQ